MNLKVFPVLIGVMSVAACTSLESNIAQTNDAALEGAAYMAPTQLVSLIATRKDAKPIKLQKAWAARVQAEIALASAKTELKAANDAFDKAKEDLEAYKGPNTDHEEELQLAFDNASIRLKRAKAAATKAATTAANAQTLVENLEDDSDRSARWVETIKLTASPPIGDPTLQFAASPNFNAMRSDEGKLTISNGLLQSANVTTSGEVDEILVSAFRAAAVFGLGIDPTGINGVLSVLPEDAKPEVDIPPEPKSLPVEACTQKDAKLLLIDIPAEYTLASNTLSLNLDPSSPSDIAEANKALCQSGYSLRIQVALNGGFPPLPKRGEEDYNAPGADNPTEDDDQEGSGNSSGNDNPAGNGNPAGNDNTSGNSGSGDADGTVNQLAVLDTLCGSTESCPGLVYRVPRPFGFRVVEVNKDRDPYVRHQQTLSLVSGAPLRLLEYKASPFTTVNNDAEFQAGVLVSYEYDRHGAVDEIVNIPFRAVSAATEAVSTLVQLRFNITDKTKDIAELEGEIARLASTDSAANELSIAEKQLEVLKVQKEILQIQADIDELQQSGDVQ